MYHHEGGTLLRGLLRTKHHLLLHHFNKDLPSEDPLHKVALAVYRTSENVVTKIEFFDAEDNNCHLDESDSLVMKVVKDAQNQPKTVYSLMEDPIRARTIDDARLINFWKQNPDLQKSNRNENISGLTIGTLAKLSIKQQRLIAKHDKNVAAIMNEGGYFAHQVGSYATIIWFGDIDNHQARNENWIRISDENGDGEINKLSRSDDDLAVDIESNEEYELTSPKEAEIQLTKLGYKVSK